MNFKESPLFTEFSCISSW